MTTVQKGIGVYRPISEITKDIKNLVSELEAAALAQETASDDSQPHEQEAE